MATRSHLLLAIVVAVIAVLVTTATVRWDGDRYRAAPPLPTYSTEGCTVSELLVPSCGAWTGVAPGAFTDQRKRSALADFESTVGAPVDIVHLYKAAGDRFPTRAERTMLQQDGARRLLMINYKPEGGYTWAEVAAGAMDRELDRQADYLRVNYRDPFFLTVHHEPEDDVVAEEGSGFTAADYAAMVRHVVERLRAGGATNFVSVLNLVGSPNWGVQPWFEQLYPGDDVVDWIAWDPYACIDAERPCGDFAGMVTRSWSDDWPGFYAWATSTHPGTPLMLAEWGVYENGAATRKAEFFTSVAQQLPDFPAIRALIYFDTPQDARGVTSVDSSEEALEAFRRLAGDRWFRQRVG